MRVLPFCYWFGHLQGALREQTPVLAWETRSVTWHGYRQPGAGSVLLLSGRQHPSLSPRSPEVLAAPAAQTAGTS